MMTESGAKLLDFGLAVPWSRPDASAPQASERTTQSVLTKPGSALGTLPYMAPEQLEGHPADQRCDIFLVRRARSRRSADRRARAFGATAEAGVMTQILGIMPKAPSRVERRVPPALDALVLRCLEKSPPRRWQSVDEVLRATDVRRMRPSKGQMALRRLAYVAAAVALVTLGIISAVVTFPLRRASSAGASGRIGGEPLSAGGAAVCDRRHGSR